VNDTFISEIYIAILQIVYSGALPT